MGTPNFDPSYNRNIDARLQGPAITLKEELLFYEINLIQRRSIQYHVQGL